MKTFLKARWKNLVFANYVVDPVVLKPYLPAGTEIDLFNNKCYVSLVGFMFLDTAIKGIRVPFHTNFEEFNLRFYVRFRDGEEWKRGVVFVREIVPRRIVAGPQKASDLRRAWTWRSLCPLSCVESAAVIAERYPGRPEIVVRGPEA